MGQNMAGIAASLETFWVARLDNIPRVIIVHGVIEAAVAAFYTDLLDIVNETG